MNNYTRKEINKRRLQFSADKCVRMHIESKKKDNKKTKETEVKKSCEDITIDHWEVETVNDGSKLLQNDVHKGQLQIKTVKNHIYLGSIIENDGSNNLNIKAKIS